MPDQVGDPLGDVPELVVECCDALGKLDCFTMCGLGGEVFVACSPRGDRDDLRGGERVACVDAKIDHPQQRGECVDRRGTLGTHVVAGGQQNLDGSAEVTVSSWFARAFIRGASTTAYPASDAARARRELVKLFVCPASGSWQGFFLFEGGGGRAGAAEVDFEGPVLGDGFVRAHGVVFDAVVLGSLDECEGVGDVAWEQELVFQCPGPAFA